MKIMLIVAISVCSMTSIAKVESKHTDHKAGGQNREEHADEKPEDPAGQGDQVKENPQFGEAKGITAASADGGIKLSLHAIKNFEIKTIKVQNLNLIILSKEAIVTAGDEVNVFRLRDEFFKRIDFVTLKKEGGQISIKSTDLKLGDEIVVQGTGFLRLAEIAAFGGAPEGHAH